MFEIMQKNVEKMTINYSPNFDPKKEIKKNKVFNLSLYWNEK